MLPESVCVYSSKSQRRSQSICTSKQKFCLECLMVLFPFKHSVVSISSLTVEFSALFLCSLGKLFWLRNNCSDCCRFKMLECFFFWLFLLWDLKERRFEKCGCEETLSCLEKLLMDLHSQQPTVEGLQRLKVIRNRCWATKTCLVIHFGLEPTVCSATSSS